jgi:hypothetical protein
METSDTRGLDAVARGRAWADERARRLRDQLPAEQWPEAWDDADNGTLPGDADGAEQLRLRMAASRAARERWHELVVQQRSAEDREREQQPLNVQEWPRARDGRRCSSAG